MLSHVLSRSEALSTERDGVLYAKRTLIRRPTDCRGLDWASPSLAQWSEPARMQSMAKTLTADDILPLVASLTPEERVRLLRLIALPQGGDAPVYRSVPPSRDEFSADEEPLAWDADGWEDVG